MEPALDSILKFYLEEELVNGGYTGAGLGVGDKVKVIENVTKKSRKSKSRPGPSKNVDKKQVENNDESSIIPALVNCLEEKGILREVQAFLRQKLVSALHGTCPQLFQDYRNQLNPIVVSLITDFLCSRKLLFSLSVLSSEIGEEYVKGNPNLTKLKSAQAENILEELEIKSNTKLSRRILYSYSHNENMSLLECIVQESGFHVIGKIANISDHDMKKYSKLLTLDEKLKKIDDKYSNGIGTEKFGADAQSVDKKFRQLALALERDKQLQLKIEIEKFKEDELYKIREQIETELKFELIKKEKELLSNYEEKVNHFKQNFEREKEMWLNERSQKEREILERREELLEAIQSLHEERLNYDKSSNSLNAVVNEERKNSLNLNFDGYNGVQDIEKSEASPAFSMKETKLDGNLTWAEKLNSKVKLPITTGTKSAKSKTVRDLTLSYTTSESELQLPHRRRKKRSRGVSVQELDRDRVALLQYQLEKQAEELEELRKTNKKNETVQESKNTNSKAKLNIMPSDLDQFIIESMKRISAIEHEADTAGKLITSYNKKKSKLEEVKAELEMEKPVKIYRSNHEDDLSFLKVSKADMLAVENYAQDKLDENKTVPTTKIEDKKKIDAPNLFTEPSPKLEPLKTLRLSENSNDANIITTISKPEAGDSAFVPGLDVKSAPVQSLTSQGSLISTSLLEKEPAKTAAVPSGDSIQPPQNQEQGSLFLASIFGAGEEKKAKRKAIAPIIEGSNSLNKPLQESHNLNDTIQPDIIVPNPTNPPLSKSLSAESNENLVIQASISGALIKDKLVDSFISQIPDESSPRSTKNSTYSESIRNPDPKRKEESKNELDNLLDGISQNSQLAKFIKVSYEDIKLYDEGIIEKERYVVEEKDASDGFW